MIYIYNIYFLEHPEKWRYPVVLENRKNWNSLDAEQLEISWNPELLVMEGYEIEDGEGGNSSMAAEELKVDVSLFGYKEEMVDGNKEVGIKCYKVL